VSKSVSEIQLSTDECFVLLRIARKAIEGAVRGIPPKKIDLDSLSPKLRALRSTFVTLTLDGDLRGCIGALKATHPLAVDVQKHAIAAAFEDPRFPPVGRDEAEKLAIEISVLSSPESLEYSQPKELIEKLKPGIDGVILQSGFHRATFLPQVWAKAPEPIQFLEMLCIKAQLPGDAWRNQRVEIQTYQVMSFHEGDLQPGKSI
jgi:AmmeMemoRadiSam system protein A